MKSAIQTKILNSLPDDRPITAIQIVESLDKCPRGFYAISRTYDQDSDADLRESSIFKSSSARYLCLSKTEGLPNFVVQEIKVLNEKNNPPQGFSLLNRTADSSQRAWKKKQLCYRLVNQKDCISAITDIIICSRLKKAPQGFSFAGELNGVTICYKMGNVQDKESPSSPPVRPPKPAGVASPTSPVYPSLSGDNSDHDYEILSPGPLGPRRPAPKPPTPVVTHQNSTHTLSGTFGALEGVPFIVNPRFLNNGGGDRHNLPIIKAKTMSQLMSEYNYPFTVERQT